MPPKLRFISILIVLTVLKVVGSFISPQKIESLFADEEVLAMFEGLKKGRNLTPAEYGSTLLRKMSDPQAWLTEEENQVLSYIGLSVPVIIYDDAAKDSPKVETPTGSGYLLFTTGSNDLKKLTLQLRPLLLHAENICKDMNKKGIITIPNFVRDNIEAVEELVESLDLARIQKVFIEVPENSSSIGIDQEFPPKVRYFDQRSNIKQLSRPDQFDSSYTGDVYLVFSVVFTDPKFMAPKSRETDRDAKLLATDALVTLTGKKGFYSKSDGFKFLTEEGKEWEGEVNIFNALSEKKIWYFYDKNCLKDIQITEEKPLIPILPGSKDPSPLSSMFSSGESDTVTPSSPTRLGRSPPRIPKKVSPPSVGSTKSKTSFWHTVKENLMIVVSIAIVVVLLMVILFIWLCVGCKKGSTGPGKVADVEFREHASAMEGANPLYSQAPPAYEASSSSAESVEIAFDAKTGDDQGPAQHPFEKY